MSINEIFSTPYFGLILSLAAFELSVYIYKKTKFPLLNPLLVSTTIIILILKTTGISYETYSIGGDYISFFLWPATVALAVPLYKQLELLKKNLIPVIGGILIGCITALISTIYISRVLGFEDIITFSLMPKSVTTPIGMVISEQLSGIPSVTVVAIIITGIAGAVLGPKVCSLLKIENKLAIGLALGTSAHAIGTSKAVEMGEIEGAMSGLAIGVAGLITVALVPLVQILVNI